MKPFLQWCQHYDYDPSSKAAAADYAKYQEQLFLFSGVLAADPDGVACLGTVEAVYSLQVETIRPRISRA